MNFKKYLINFLSVFALSLFLQSASAEESGTFKAITIMTYDYTTIERPGYTYFGGPAHGGHVVIESSGGPFVVDEMENIRCLVFAKGQPNDLEIESPCEVTNPSGDKLHVIAKRTPADISEETTEAGTWQIIDGTGKYENIRGECSYTPKYLKDGVIGIPSNCEWTKKEH